MNIRKFDMCVGDIIMFSDNRLFIPDILVLCQVSHEFNVLDMADEYRKQNDNHSDFLAWLEREKQVIIRVDFRAVDLGFDGGLLPVLMRE